MQPRQETLPGRTGRYPGDGNDQHFPKEAACSEEKTPLLCTKLQGCVARLRGVFLNFSQLLQNLKVAGQYFGMFWALLSVSCRDCSYLDLPQNYCFFFTVWVRWKECLPGSAHHKPAKGALIWGPLFWGVEFNIV